MNLRYILLFILIQIISIFGLFAPGVVLCGICTLFKLYELRDNPTPLHPWNDPKIYRWTPRWMWIWDNREDGLSPVWYLAAHPAYTVKIFGRTFSIKRTLRWNFFIWTAFRNYANNWRFVPGVSKVGRPIFSRAFTLRGKLRHFDAGWLPDGYPTLNIGLGPW
jgi:hypothetical protein